jgi:putative oxidoreductase
MPLQTLCTLKERLLPLAPVGLRLALGVVFIAHGLDKLFGTFGGGGLEATTQQFAELGLQPAHLQALAAGITEALGGVFVALGLLTRLGGLMLVSTMVVAIATVHLSGGLFARDGGFEYPLVILGGALYLTLAGGGKFSLDALLVRHVPFLRKMKEGQCPL